MDEERRRAALEAARGLEARGSRPAAVQAYLEAGAVEDAARLLASERRFAEAGELLWGSLSIAEPKEAARLEPLLRKRALTAAICFGKAGHTERAVALLVELGERDRAVELLQRAGDSVGAARLQAAQLKVPGKAQPLGLLPRPVDTGVTLQSAQKLEAAGKHQLAMEAYLQLRQPAAAARMAVALGKLNEAAQFFLEAGQPYEAAVCYQKLGAAGACLSALVRVPRDDPRYRKACLQAVRLAQEAGTLDFQLENFLTRFVQTGPLDEKEEEAFYLLARLYRRHDFVENARDALEKLVARNPAYRDAPAVLAELNAETRGSAAVYDKILKEDLAFRAASATRRPGPVAAELPELPDLPPLPPATRAPAAPPATDGTVVRPDSRPRLGEPPAPGATAPPPAAAATAAMPAQARFEPGVVIAERYRLEKQIGQGGMASVFRATDQELNEQVAIKVFNQALEGEEALARFKREVSLSRQLNHPNVIRLYDIGTFQGRKYLTMELLSGSDLAGKLEAGRPIPFSEALDYLIQACAGLQAAHDRGIVHRDVKPQNLFLTGEGVVKVMDFGIAKGRSSPGITLAGVIAGTPEYMSPEQIQGFNQAGPSTDLYALGVSLFALCTGRPPFSHPEWTQLLLMHMNQPPPRPRELNPGIPPELEAVILRLLEKDPAARFPSCRELAQVLEPLRQSLALDELL